MRACALRGATVPGSAVMPLGIPLRNNAAVWNSMCMALWLLATRRALQLYLNTDLCALSIHNPLCLCVLDFYESRSHGLSLNVYTLKRMAGGSGTCLGEVGGGLEDDEGGVGVALQLVELEGGRCGRVVNRISGSGGRPSTGAGGCRGRGRGWRRRRRRHGWDTGGGASP